MRRIFFILFVMSLSDSLPGEQVGLRIDLEKREMKMIVVSSEFQDAMTKVVQIMQAAETATVESSPDSLKIKSQRETED